MSQMSLAEWARDRLVGRSLQEATQIARAMKIRLSKEDPKDGLVPYLRVNPAMGPPLGLSVDIFTENDVVVRATGNYLWG